MKKLSAIVVVCLLSALAGFADAKDIKIKAMMPILKYQDNGQQAILDKVKELTGVEIEMMIPEEFDEEKTKLALAAGEIPDMMEVPGNLYPTLIDEGLFIDLKPMIENSKFAKAAIPQVMLDAVTRKDGKIYGMPVQHPGGCVGYLRKDWLDKLGLEIPKTYDEFVEVLRAFTFKDPDGDGKDNTYGYTTLVNNDFDNYNRLIFQDAVVGFLPKNGEWVDGFLEPEMEAALGRLKSLYDEGLVDPQFITAKKTSEARSKLIEGKVGVFEYWAGEWAMNLDEYTKKVNPENAIVSMPPLEGMQYKIRRPVVWSITVTAEDPQVIFDQIFDGLFDKGERQTVWTYGLEGMHWVKEGDSAKFLPTKVDPKRIFKKARFSRELQLNDMPLIVPLDSRVTASMANFTNTWQEEYPPTSATYSKYWGDIMNLKKEVVLKIVTGDYGINEGLQAYKEKAEKEFKLAKILEELNKE